MNRKAVIIPAICLTAAGVAALWWSQPDPEEAASAAKPARVSPTSRDRPAYPPNLLTPQVKIIVSGGKVGLAARKEAIASLPRNLEAPDLTALLDFANGERPGEVTLKSWHAMVDQLINALQQQDVAPPGLTGALVRMYRESSDPTLRDYALQYLRSWYAEREGHFKHEPDIAARELILHTLMEAASRTGRTSSGTAIMALHEAFDSQGLAAEPETREQLDAQLGNYEEILVEAVRNPGTDKHCRISTLQICAMRGMEQVLPDARALAADPATDPNVRISAIAAIGRLGNLGEDGPLLRSLSSQGLRLGYAAQPALEKLAGK